MNTFSLIINTATKRWINPKYLYRLLPCSKIPTLYYMDSYELDLTLLNSDLTPYQIPDNATIRFSGDINRSRSDNLMVFASGSDITVTDASQGKLTIKLKCDATAFYEKAGCDMIVSLTINDTTVLDDRVFAKRGTYNGEIKDIVVGEEYKPWSEIKEYIDEKSDYFIFPVTIPKNSETAYLEFEWSRTPSFDDILSIYTIDDNTDVYAFNGLVWEPYPQEGITAAHTYVRVPKLGIFYRYRFVNGENRTVWNPAAAAEIDTSILTYTDSSGATIKVGGWSVGDKAEEMSFQDFAYKLLHPYESPTITLTLSPSNLTYEHGQELYAVTMIANVTKKSKDIQAVGFYVGNTVVNLITEGVSTGGKFSYTYIPNTPITKTTTFKVEATDGEKTVSAQKTISFVYTI